MTYNKQQLTHDKNWLIPDQVTENPLQFCSFETETKSFTGMTGYTENLHVYVKASFKYLAGEFSVSTDYKRSEDEMKKSSKVSF